MPPLSPQNAKLCAICHKDCSRVPRTRDGKGQYFCRECVERVKRDRRERQDEAELDEVDDRSASGTVVLDSGFVLTPEDVVGIGADYALVTGDPDFFEPEPRFRLGHILAQPWVAFVLPLAVLGLLYLAVRTAGDAAMLFIAPTLVYVVAVGLIVRIAAFMDGLGTGLVTLFVPFYEFYFVVVINDNRHIKALHASAVLALAAMFFLIDKLVVAP